MFISSRIPTVWHIDPQYDILVCVQPFFFFCSLCLCLVKSVLCSLWFLSNKGSDIQNFADHTSSKFSEHGYLPSFEDRVPLQTVQVKNIKAKRSRILKRWTETRWVDYTKIWCIQSEAKVIQFTDLKDQIYSRKITCFMSFFK